MTNVLVFKTRLAVLLVLALRVCAVLFVTADVCYADSRTFSFWSFALRDRPPSVAESKSFAAGNRALDSFVADWLDSDDHDQSVLRLFNDMLGVGDGIFLMNKLFYLKRSDENVRYLEVKGSCAKSEAVATQVWWSDTLQQVCPTSLSAMMMFSDGVDDDAQEIRCAKSGLDGIRHAKCGCGPEMLLCLPEEQVDQLRDDIQFEGARRGLHAYRQGTGWEAVFSGSTFLGSRLLYWYYLYQILATSGNSPSAVLLKALHSLPIVGEGEVAYPEEEGFPARGSIVTSPGFMKQFNNFRSRIRGLTETLLCTSIGPHLNTDNIAKFVNPDLSDIDKGHGSKAGCTGCHYVLDNFGSTLLGWNDQGLWKSWKNPSQRGHVFGVDGVGPAFLMVQYLAQRELFLPCMAKKFWQHVAAFPWDQLSEATRKGFVTAALDGPQQLFYAIIYSNEFHNLR